MRKIEKEMIKALNEEVPFNSRYLQVYIDKECFFTSHVFLNFRLIATVVNDPHYLRLTITDGKKKSAATKRILNYLLSCLLFHEKVPKIPRISSKGKQWYIGKEIWTGNKIFEF